MGRIEDREVSERARLRSPLVILRAAGLDVGEVGVRALVEIRGRGLGLRERFARFVDGDLFGGPGLGSPYNRLAKRAGRASIHRIGHVGLLCAFRKHKLLGNKGIGVGAPGYERQLVSHEPRDLAKGLAADLDDLGGKLETADGHHLVDAVQDLLDSNRVHDMDVRLHPASDIVKVELEHGPGVPTLRIVHLAEHGPLHEIGSRGLERVVIDDFALAVRSLGSHGAVDEQRTVVAFRDVLDRGGQPEGGIGGVQHVSHRRAPRTWFGRGQVSGPQRVPA